MRHLDTISLLVKCTRLGGLYASIVKRVLAEHGSPELIQEQIKAKGLELSPKELALTKDQIQKWQLQGLEILSFFDKNYPKALKEIADPPPVIFVKGSKPFPEKLPLMLSIVGSRKAGAEGSEFARYLACELASRGVVVVSGLALGIDGCAHKGALQADLELSTIAVLGNGLEKVYPSSHHNLASEIIARGGFLISQFEPSERPYPSNFLNRNRIIAGLSMGTIVVQAAKRSGSLATARYAIESGREVFAVPGLPTHKMYEGTNNLIKQGARILTSIDDVLDEFPELADKGGSLELDENEFKILRLIYEAGELPADELLQISNGRGELSILLLALEEKGLLVRLSGNRFGVSPLACGIF